LKKENFLFLNEEIKKSLLKIADEERFNSLEIPSKFIFTMKEFTVENEMMTPSMKLVRYKIRDYYSEEVKKLYKSEG
jgi:long-chain acyl-CoA synthetase